MKIAINLIGVSLGLRNRDWNRTKHGIKEKIIDCWVEQGHEVKTYLISNYTDQDMINFYNPVKYQTTPNTLMTKYQIALNQLEDQDIDFIICTRFDIVPFNNVCSWNLNFDKFNFLFREINHFYDGRGYTCDNFYAFPKKFLKSFIQALTHPDNPPFAGMLHNQVYNGLEKIITKDNIHFIQEEEGYSGYNTFYVLNRYNKIQGDSGPTSIEMFNNLTKEEIELVKFGNFTRWS
jgi:hypothetical protein